MSEISGFYGDNRWLSNLAPISIKMDGLLFHSVENAFNAARTYERYWPEYQRVTSGQSKALSRQHPPRVGWAHERIAVMKGLLRQKFADKYYREKLKATGDSKLIHTNTWDDTLWGVCNGKGSNLLGQLLMELRDTL